MAGWSIVVPSRDVADLGGERVFGRLDPRLTGYVLSCTAHDHTPAEAKTWTVGPLGALLLIVDLERPVGGQPPSPVSGLRDQPMVLEQHPGRSKGITVALTPAGAYALFGLPLRELANTTIALSELIGAAAATELAERLAESPDWESRFALLGDWLMGRLAPGPEISTPVLGAWRQLERTAGRVRISELVELTGWTRQHLNARFREQIGLAPKVVARVARLRLATSLMTRPDPPPLADLAVRCGYSDQAHFNREFRELTGWTPSDYVPR